MRRQRARWREPLLQAGPWYLFAATLLKPWTTLRTRPVWRGAEHVPATGGVILAVNHISTADPVVLADFVLFALHRPARFLAKSTLFVGGGLVARVLRGAGQIPVHRGTADASKALEAAVAALQAGECVVLYPEGTVTKDPERWPMLAKTGVARLALLSGAPVVPVGQWGAQRLRAVGTERLPVTVVAGPAVDLSAYRERELTGEVLRAATDDVMRAVTSLVAELRGETPPARPYDPQHTASRGQDESRTA
ncbi:MAG: phospholipid/glycerol acyltransferase [Frankiales bacterium]|nr:phospholipid/glycerol acyltransferase [Frankiales bacterium]